MNKRNFGRVLRRVEAAASGGIGAGGHRWSQMVAPALIDTRGCGAPMCFLGFAELVRTEGRTSTNLRGNCRIGFNLKGTTACAKWLGLTGDQMHTVYRGGNTLADFRAWHKAGHVPPWK